ncbi:hypothetical protein ANCCAN_00761 [Ancylostoma caninum]|uniref:Uncharacterized protein n=1 Tax=Ancylostoma caninum TaxID=29170 RepID=A0A368H9E4_ANCCA|nr:hypothetical protein ANCCAN_00761 [Ancylostoma caninum]
MADDEVLKFCNVIIGFHPDVAKEWTSCNVAINVGVLILYLSVFLVLKYRRNPTGYKEYRKVIRRLSVIVLVFICSWFMALLGSTLFIALGVPPAIMAHLQMNMVCSTA